MSLIFQWTNSKLFSTLSLPRESNSLFFFITIVKGIVFTEFIEFGENKFDLEIV